MTNRVELSISERFPFAERHEFGAAGAYESLIGRAHFAVDPRAPAQKDITDIDKAAVYGEERAATAADDWGGPRHDIKLK